MKCNKCDVELIDSNWNIGVKRHRIYICKSCDNILSKEQRKKNHLKIKEYMAAYYLKNKVSIKLASRDYHRKHKLDTTSGLITHLNKRPHTLICELCNAEVKHTVYHHWDDSNPELGIWICTLCHFTVERIEKIPHIKRLYINLKKKLTGEYHDSYE